MRARFQIAMFLCLAAAASSAYADEARHANCHVVAATSVRNQLTPVEHSPEIKLEAPKPFEVKDADAASVRELSDTILKRAHADPHMIAMVTAEVLEQVFSREIKESSVLLAYLVKENGAGAVSQETTEIAVMSQKLMNHQKRMMTLTEPGLWRKSAHIVEQAQHRKRC